MVISYEIYDTSLRVIAPRMNMISVRKHIADTDVVNDFTYSRQSVIIHLWSYDFYDMTLSAE